MIETNAATEIWMSLTPDGYPYHAISNLGRIKNIRTGTISSTYKYPKSNYRYTTLYNPISRKIKTIKIHPMVAKYFLPPKPGPEYQIDHVDNDQGNNAASNLQWKTQPENIQKSYNETTRTDGGVTVPMMPEEIVEIIRLFKQGMSQVQIGKLYNVHNSTICRVLQRNNVKRDTRRLRKLPNQRYARKMNPKRREQLWYLFNNGFTATQLMNLFGISRFYVQRLCHDFREVGRPVPELAFPVTQNVGQAQSSL